MRRVAGLFVASRGSRGSIIIVSLCLCKPGAGAAAEFGPAAAPSKVSPLRAGPRAASREVSRRSQDVGGRGGHTGQVVSLHLPVRTINMNKSPKSATDERYQPLRPTQGATQSRKINKHVQIHHYPPSTSNSRDFHLTRRGKEARRVRDGNKVTILILFYFGASVPLPPPICLLQAFDSPAPGWEDMTERRLRFPAQSQHKTFPRGCIY